MTVTETAPQPESLDEHSQHDTPVVGKQFSEQYADPNKRYVILPQEAGEPRWVSPDVVEGGVPLKASGRRDLAEAIRNGEVQPGGTLGSITPNGNFHIVYGQKGLPEDTLTPASLEHSGPDNQGR